MSVGGGIIIGLLVVWFITTAAAIISFERWYRAKYTKKRGHERPHVVRS